MEMHQKVRVRFAPSPTGYLHVGGLRTALYNFLHARRHNGVFILRIEDTDRSRYVDGAASGLMDTLRWAGLVWDEGPGIGGPHAPYVQSQRTESYKTHADLLLSEGKAYRCFCAAEELEEQRKRQIDARKPPMYDRRCRAIDRAQSDARASAGEAHTVRLRVPLTGETTFEDLIRGEIRVKNSLIDDQVLLKSDGYPTYHLANVVDDHTMEISDVIRGEEWLPSTAKHILLYQAFGWNAPNFAHLPLLLNADRSKLSKRQGDVAVEEYRSAGYLPEAMINFVALLGWNVPGNREMFTLKELSSLFSIDRVGKAGAVFDINKLRWFNGQYLRALAPEQRLQLCLPYLETAYKPSDADRSSRIVEALSSHLTLPSDIIEEAAPFYTDIAAAMSREAIEVMAGDESRAVLHSFASQMRETPNWRREEIKELFAKLQELTGVKGKRLFMPIRVALTGRLHGPELPVVAELLGRSVCLERVKSAIQ